MFVDSPVPAPYDIIGDVHGCFAELIELLTQLGYSLDDAPLSHIRPPPSGRTAVFVGDLTDRGPESAAVLRLVMGMVTAGDALVVRGNHDDKLARALAGNDVSFSHGLSETMEELAALNDPGFVEEARQFLESLPFYLLMDGGRLIVVHAGLKEHHVGRTDGRVRAMALYGDTTGARTAEGYPVRRSWELEYTGEAMIIYGHTPVSEAVWINNTMCIDTACVFGGSLTALRYPEQTLVQVPAAQAWATTNLKVPGTRIW
ncbi:metallophosphoesterase [Corynebacterium sputi]|uniref:metallophosphoesterase n=1 Tax=Corynebacterium sputi TaxID=489915 RepID=UPI000415B5A8|nr:metallophosphoesterase [Corynebacterium sputi]